MSNVFFSAIDENYNFPFEIRSKLSSSFELKNLVVPMTRATRDNLKAGEVWNGRVIYNLTSKILEVFETSQNTWVKILNTEFLPPEPKAPWDSKYILPLLVRKALSESPELRNLIIPMTNSYKLNLDQDNLWVGFTIYNIDSGLLETWIGTKWASGYRSDLKTNWIQCNPVLKLIPSQTIQTYPPLPDDAGPILNVWSKPGEYFVKGKLVVFKFALDWALEQFTNLNEEYRLVPPIPPATNMEIPSVGVLQFRGVYGSYGTPYYVGLSVLDPDTKLIYFELMPPAHWNEDHQPCLWRLKDSEPSGLKTANIKGHISYPCD